ncbi:MAG TPA: hypothetical protein PK400_07610 [Phycisphaerales bacterium]|nr:hypothetical protein [Phycisphaerales bacterium]HRQ75856.1 hypothetical protein [Phycisphaerales bacterium]
MILIVDTYNVLHVTGVLPPDLAGIDTRGLIELIRQSRYGHSRVELICDGRAPGTCRPTGTASVAPALPVRGRGSALPPDAPPARVGLIAVHYAGPGREADDLIAALIRASTTPRQLVVISADHFVQREAKRRRCRVLESETFLRQLAEDALGGAEGPANAPRKPASALTEAQVEQWLDAFGVDDEAEIERLLMEADDSLQIEEEHVERGSDVRASSSINLPSNTLPPDIVREAERIWKEFDERNNASL